MRNDNKTLIVFEVSKSFDTLLRIKAGSKRISKSELIRSAIVAGLKTLESEVSNAVPGQIQKNSN